MSETAGQSASYSTICCAKSEMPHDDCCPVCFAGPDEACINTRTENVVQTHKRRHPSPHPMKTQYRVIYVDHGYDVGDSWEDEKPFTEFQYSTYRVWRGETREVRADV